ncbi:MAG TPA: efflux RND transporter periplasmic adaptor subunit [Chthoniobacterales bacterium]|nr:efflux RND transporter periplasmic adaptor subunit [Chthoniobacterales bacterium]
MKLPESKRILWVAGALLVLICGVAYYLFMPVAEIAVVRRGTAISAVYGTVRIEPAFVIHVRAQNSGFIRLADEFSAGRGAIGKAVAKGQVLGTIADETTARQLKQATADQQAAMERAKLPLPSEELLKAAEDNLHRLEQVVATGNVPAVDYEKAKSEANRLRGAVENERIERERNLDALDETRKKLESQMRNSEIRSPMDGLLSAVQTIDGELVNEGNQLFTISSRKTYVRGEVNEEDVGQVKTGMNAKTQLYAFQNATFAAKVSSIQPAADPDTQRYTVILEMEKPPDNLMAGMTGEMNIITGTHENALLVPTRALLVDQALIIKHGMVQRRTVKVGFRTLDFSEALSGVSLGDHVVIADQDRLHPGEPVRQRKVDIATVLKR